MLAASQSIGKKKTIIQFVRWKQFKHFREIKQTLFLVRNTLWFAVVCDRMDEGLEW